MLNVLKVRNVFIQINILNIRFLPQLMCDVWIMFEQSLVKGEKKNKIAGGENFVYPSNIQFFSSTVLFFFKTKWGAKFRMIFTINAICMFLSLFSWKTEIQGDLFCRQTEEIVLKWIIICSLLLFYKDKEVL